MTQHSSTPPALADQARNLARHRLSAEETLIQLDSSAAGLSTQIAMGKAGTEVTKPNFLRTMGFTGLLTAAVAFGVYWYVLETETTEIARSYAFAVLVFAGLLRAFGARSETKPVWCISLLTNLNLVVVIAVSFGLHVSSQHNEMLGRFLKTSYLPFTDCLLLFALGAIPAVYSGTGETGVARPGAKRSTDLAKSLKPNRKAS